MTVPAEKEVSLLGTRFEPLLLRHPTNPILTSKDWPYPINSVFNCGRDSTRGWDDPTPLPRGRSTRPVASLRRAFSQRSRWMADR
jgi:hypothetical protein